MPTNWDDFSDVVTVEEESPTATNWDAFSDPLNGVDESIVSQPLGGPALQGFTSTLTSAQRQAPGFHSFAKKNNALPLVFDSTAEAYADDPYYKSLTPDELSWAQKELGAPTQTRAEAMKASPFKTEAELFDAYQKQHGTLRSYGEQAAIGLGTGIMRSLVKPVGTILGKVTGDASYLDDSARMGKDLGEIDAVRAALPAGQFAGDVFNAAGSIAPTILAGPLGMGAVLLAAGGQSAVDTFQSARDAGLEKGLTEDEAQSQATLPALASGLATALTTALVPKGLDKLAPGVFGQGVEAVAVRGGLATKAASTIKEFITQFGKGAAGEVPEEMIDQFAQGLIEKASFNPDKTMQEILADSVEAGKMAAVLGGAVQSLNSLGSKKAQALAGMDAKNGVTPPTPLTQDPVAVADAASASLLAEAEASDSDEVKAQLTAKADFFANPAHQEVLADSVQELSDLQEEAKTATPERKLEIEQEVEDHPLNGVTSITPENAGAVQAAISERFKVQQEVEATNVAVQATAPVVAQLEEQGLTEAAQILKDNNKLIVKTAVRDKVKQFALDSRVEAQKKFDEMFPRQDAVDVPEQVATEQPVAATESTPVASESAPSVETAAEAVTAPEASIEPVDVEVLSPTAKTVKINHPVYGNRDAEVIEEYKGEYIARVDGDIAVISKDGKTVQFPALDDSKSTGKNVWVEGSDNFQTARALIDWNERARSENAKLPPVETDARTGEQIAKDQSEAMDADRAKRNALRLTSKASPKSKADKGIADEQPAQEVAPASAKAETPTEPAPTQEPAPIKVSLKVLSRSKNGSVTFKAKEESHTAESLQAELTEAQDNATVYDQLLDCLGRKMK